MRHLGPLTVLGPGAAEHSIWQSGRVDPVKPFTDDAALRRDIAQKATLVARPRMPSLILTRPDIPIAVSDVPSTCRCPQ